MKPTALVLSGTGRYGDPWHDFPGTSSALVVVLTQVGVDARTVETTPEAITRLGDAVDPPSLVVVNAGGGDPQGRGEADPAWLAARDVLASLLDTGVPLLGAHAAANTFVDVPGYRARLGGHWDPAVSFHPERGRAEFRALSDHPALGGAADVVVDDDERYSSLVIDDDVVPLLGHEFDGETHVAAWARHDARGRVVYDGLGHHRPSYRSPDRLALLRSEIA